MAFPHLIFSYPFSLGRLEAPWSRKLLCLLCSPAKFHISRWCQPCAEQIKQENKSKTAMQEGQKIAKEAEKGRKKNGGPKRRLWKLAGNGAAVSSDMKNKFKYIYFSERSFSNYIFILHNLVSTTSVKSHTLYSMQRAPNMAMRLQHPKQR